MHYIHALAPLQFLDVCVNINLWSERVGNTKGKEGGEEKEMTLLKVWNLISRMSNVLSQETGHLSSCPRRGSTSVHFLPIHCNTWYSPTFVWSCRWCRQRVNYYSTLLLLNYFPNHTLNGWESSRGWRGMNFRVHASSTNENQIEQLESWI